MTENEQAPAPVAAPPAAAAVAAADAAAAAPAPRCNERLGRRLVAVLKKELVQQHRLLGVAAQTRAAIVERNLDLLEAMRLRHEEILASAERLAQERLQISRSILRAAGRSCDAPTLSEVAGCCSGGVVPLIGAVREILIEVAQQARDANGLNRQLLENELEYIGASLEVVARAAAAGVRTTYRAACRPDAPSGGAPALLLDRAA